MAKTRIRRLSARIRHALGSNEPGAHHLELRGPILIRYSQPRDESALRRLADPTANVRELLAIQVKTRREAGINAVLRCR